MVPISVSTASSPDKAVLRTVLDKPTLEITVDDVKEGDWLKVRGSSYAVEGWFGLCVFRHLLQSLSDYYSRCGPPF